jgi:hypothetical protein
MQKGSSFLHHKISVSGKKGGGDNVKWTNLNGHNIKPVPATYVTVPRDVIKYSQDHIPISDMSIYN